jgi:serum/glucocorticoid-regulated kinase 2
MGKKKSPNAQHGTGSHISSSVTIDDFEILQVVGKGSYGKVMQVRKRDTGKIYAMKVLKKQMLVARKQVAHTKTERRVLELIDHPFLVTLQFAFQSETKLYMVLDYFTGGELFFHLKHGGKFSESRARFYAAEISLALQCLHDNKIIYRDLKPENVLLDDEGHIRLTDFGLSKESTQGQQLTHTFCGTPEYLAPEVIQGSWYGHAVDWWSMGTLLYEMLTGWPPFYNENLHVMYERITRAPLNFPNDMSNEAKSLLTGLLQRDPRKRLGSKDGMQDFKDHPFFASINWRELYEKKTPPPFIPETTEGVLSTDNVDEEFKQELPQDTPVQPSDIPQDPVQFDSFTFATNNTIS